METTSIVKIVSKFQSSFRENKQNYGIRRKVGNLSPTIELNKYKGLLLLGNSEKKATVNIKLNNNESDFYEEISQECRKLDSNFIVIKDKANCFKMISETIKKAVDLIIKERNINVQEEIDTIKKENFELTKELNELKLKLQTIIAKEKQDSMREENIKTEELRIIIERKILQNEKNQINSSRKYYFQMESDVKNLKEELKAQQKYSKIEFFKRLFVEKEIVNSNSVESEQEKITPEDLLPKKNSGQFIKTLLNKSISEKTIKFEDIEIKYAGLIKDQELFREEQENFKKIFEIYQVDKTQLELQMKAIQEFQEKASKIENDLNQREELIKLKEIAVDKDKIALEEAWNNIQRCEVAQPYDKELEKVFTELQIQIDNYNREVSEKEAFFNEWSERLNTREKSLDLRYVEIKAIESNLRNSELELNLLNRETIPNLEFQSNKINNLLKELYHKKIELDSQFKKLAEEKILLEKQKKEIKAKNNSREYIEKIINQIKNISNKESEIKNLEYSQCISGQEINKIIENLKQERINFENSKIQQEKLCNSISINFQSLIKALDSIICTIKKKEIEISSQKISST